MSNDGKKSAKRGLDSLTHRVSGRGKGVIDRRSTPYRTWKEWCSKAVAALGGDAAITEQRRALVEACMRTRLLLDHVDGYLLELPSLINRKRKSMIPIIEQRQRLADSLLRQLQTLGLDAIEGEIELPWEKERVVPWDERETPADDAAQAKEAQE